MLAKKVIGERRVTRFSQRISREEESRTLIIALSDRRYEPAGEFAALLVISWTNLCVEPFLSSYSIAPVFSYRA